MIAAKKFRRGMKYNRCASDAGALSISRKAEARRKPLTEPWFADRAALVCPPETKQLNEADSDKKLGLPPESTPPVQVFPWLNAALESTLIDRRPRSSERKRCFQI
jgi:hypothetical protein